jgi:hypothetical protein
LNSTSDHRKRDAVTSGATTKSPALRRDFLGSRLSLTSRLPAALALLTGALALTVGILLLLAGLLPSALLLSGFLTGGLVLLARILLAWILVLAGHRNLPC